MIENFFDLIGDRKLAADISEICIGSRVSWNSVAGIKEGVVKNVLISRNIYDALVPWLDVDHDTGHKKVCIRLCALPISLETAGVRVLPKRPKRRKKIVY